jgi:hypothetical protein
MKPDVRRRAALRDLAAEGDETAAHDLFAEYGETAGPAPHVPPPCGDAGEQTQQTASNRKGT